MLYLSSFYFPDVETEMDFRNGRGKQQMSCWQTMYPFFVLSEKHLEELFFRPITILYGGNGSGKSTALNIIAEKLGLERQSVYNRSNFYEDYLSLCSFTTEEDIPKTGRIITSDDVFDYMLNIRTMNEGIDGSRDKLLDEYRRLRGERFQLRSMEDYDQLKKVVDAQRMTRSRFVASRSEASIRERSNGESALMYFREHIREDTLCLLDEPENSLSPENQRVLTDFLAESVRYCGCQLVISTHSPFLLALPGAKIIDLDNGSHTVENWAELKNVRVYYDFFKKNARRFEPEE